MRSASDTRSGSTVRDYIHGTRLAQAHLLAGE